MKKLMLASLLSGMLASGFANSLSLPEKVSVNTYQTGNSKAFFPVAVATYKSKCGDVWDFIITYTNLRQLPGYLMQMMDDADRACGTKISYIQY